MKRFKAIYAKDALGEISRDVWEPENPSERVTRPLPEPFTLTQSVGSHGS